MIPLLSPIAKHDPGSYLPLRSMILGPISHSYLPFLILSPFLVQVNRSPFTLQGGPMRFYVRFWEIGLLPGGPRRTRYGVSSHEGKA